MKGLQIPIVKDAGISAVQIVAQSRHRAHQEQFMHIKRDFANVEWQIAISC